MLRKYYYRSFLRDELPATKHSNRDVVELTLVRDIQLTHQLHRARIFSVMRCLCGLQQSGWAHKDTSVDTLDELLRYRLVEWEMCSLSLALSISSDPIAGMPMAEATL